jgi:hypothetical protein
MKTIAEKRQIKNKKKIKKQRGFITTQKGCEKHNKEGKICNQKGAFGQCKSI